MLPHSLRRAEVLLWVISALGGFAFLMLVISPDAVVHGTWLASAVGAVDVVLTFLGALGLHRGRAWGYWSAVASVLCFVPETALDANGWELAALVDAFLGTWLYQGRAFVRPDVPRPWPGAAF